MRTIPYRVPWGDFKNTYELLHLKLLRFHRRIKVLSFNLWASVRKKTLFQVGQCKLCNICSHLKRVLIADRSTHLIKCMLLSATSIHFKWEQMLYHLKCLYTSLNFHMKTKSDRYKTYLRVDKLANVLQTIFLNLLFCSRIIVFWFRFHWSLFPRSWFDNTSALIQVMVWYETGDKPWTSYQTRKIAGSACTRNAGKVSDPNMHHGTCVTHVPWCMPGSLTCGLLWSGWAG